MNLLAPAIWLNMTPSKLHCIAASLPGCSGPHGQPASQVLAGAEALGTLAGRACSAAVGTGRAWSAVFGMRSKHAGISRTGQEPVAELQTGAGACCFAVAHASRSVALAAKSTAPRRRVCSGQQSPASVPLLALALLLRAHPGDAVCSAAGQLAGRLSRCPAAECVSIHTQSYPDAGLP